MSKKLKYAIRFGCLTSISLTITLLLLKNPNFLGAAFLGGFYAALGYFRGFSACEERHL